MDPTPRLLVSRLSLSLKASSRFAPSFLSQHQRRLLMLCRLMIRRHSLSRLATRASDGKERHQQQQQQQLKQMVFNSMHHASRDKATQVSLLQRKREKHGNPFICRRKQDREDGRLLPCFCSTCAADPPPKQSALRQLNTCACARVMLQPTIADDEGECWCVTVYPLASP